MMKKIRNIIFVLILLVGWMFIYIFIVNKDEVRTQKSVSQYILINQFTCWKYTNSKWKSLSYTTDEFNTSQELNWKKYDIYINNQYYNTLDYVVKNGQEFYFDDNTHSYEINDEKIMFNKDSYLKLINFNKVDLFSDDEVIINKILRKYRFFDEEITMKDKYSIDGDDGVIYFVSNHTGKYMTDSQQEFNLMFYRVNGINYILINTGFIEHRNSYRLAFVVDAKNKFNNFVIAANCEGGSCYWMYEYKKGEFVSVTD